jgi:hypothetical protein
MQRTTGLHALHRVTTVRGCQSFGTDDAMTGAKLEDPRKRATQSRTPMDGDVRIVSALPGRGLPTVRPTSPNRLAVRAISRRGRFARSWPIRHAHSRRCAARRAAEKNVPEPPARTGMVRRSPSECSGAPVGARPRRADRRIVGGRGSTFNRSGRRRESSLANRGP